MFKMILENESGKQITIGAGTDGTDYPIKEFSGLNPPKATINTSTTALIDGGIYNSAKLNMRSMNIAFAVEQNAAESRLAIYKVIQNKKPIKVYYKSEVLDIFIEGYVEDTDFSYFAQKNICTVSILCPSPYFKGAQEIINELSAIIPRFYFPFGSLARPDQSLVMGEIDVLTSVEVHNNGNAEAGLTFELYAKGDITNPKIIDYTTGEYLKLNIEMELGDLITITTGQGQKKITLLKGGVETNIFNAFDVDSTWLQLSTEGNVYVYEVEYGSITNLVVTIKHYDLYEGV
jgi:hypothetical protein